MEEEYLRTSKDNLASIDSAIDLEDGKALVRDGEAGRPSKDGGDSIDHADGTLKISLSPASPTLSHFEQKPDSPRRRSGLFRRLRGQKD